jgi:hypothetical protein
MSSDAPSRGLGVDQSSHSGWACAPASKWMTSSSQAGAELGELLHVAQIGKSVR